MARNNRRNRAARSRKKIARKRSSVTQSSGTNARALNIEHLEDRRLLAVFTVTNPFDLVADLSAPYAGSLRQAIVNANDSPGADTIVFSPTTFSAANNFIVLEDNLAGEFGDLPIEESLTILGPGPRKITIFGTSGSRIFTIGDDSDDMFFNVQISGLTLSGGSPSGEDDEDNVGGAILNKESLQIIESEISGNSANRGGGIFTDLGDLHVDRSLIRNNLASLHGGGIYNGIAGNNTLSTTLITNSTLSGNIANASDGQVKGYGGGAFNNYGYMYIRNSTISGNSAYLGGGLASAAYEDIPMQSPEPIKLTIGSSIVFGNSVSSGLIGAGDLDDPGARAADPSGFPSVPYPFKAGLVTENWNIIGTGTALDSSFKSRFDRTDVTRNPAINPLLGPLGDYGGALDAYSLGEGSIAIDSTWVPSSFIADSDGVDFNNDGEIGGTDFLAWQRGFGKPAIVEPPEVPEPVFKTDGDANGDFIVDADDLESWIDLFGDVAQPHTPPGNTVIIEGDPIFNVYVAPLGNLDVRGFHFDRIFGGIVDLGSYEVQEATFVVNVLDDQEDNQVTSTFANFGNTIPGNFSLREANDFAEKNPGTDTIVFDSSLANSSLNPDPVPATPAPTILLDRSNGPLTFTESVNIIGPTTFQLEVDGNDPTPGLAFSDGIRVFIFDDGNDNVLQDVVFSNLTVVGADTFGSGGGIRNFENLEITSSSFENNFASFNGGGVFTQFGEVNISNSTFAGNRASSNGGGLYVSGVASLDVSIPPNPEFVGKISKFTITQSTVSGNTAGLFGGGIFNGGPDAEISYSTITLNGATPTLGSGVWNFPTTDARNTKNPGEHTLAVTSTIISGNNNGDDIGESPMAQDFISSGGYNLIGGGNATFAFEFDGSSLTGEFDPGLAPLSLAGGITKTHIVLDGSPAENAGNPSPINAALFDQRDFPFVRVHDGRIDIGAYELQAIPHIVDNAGDASDGMFGPGQLTLREAIELSNISPALDSIEFSPTLFGATISVGSPLVITDTVTITGLGSSLLSITSGVNTALLIDDGNAASSISVNITGIEFTGGSAGFIFNKENLTLGSLIQRGRGVILTGNTGGAVVQQGGSLALIDSTVTGNSRSGSGGAFFVEDADFAITYSGISGNITSISEGHGGAIYLKNATFTGDFAFLTGNATPSGDSDGGAIFAVDSTIDLMGSIISGNTTTGSNSEGAGIAALNTDITLRKNAGGASTIVALNRTTGTQSQGAGIYLSGGSLTLEEGTLVTQNTTEGLLAHGAAIANHGGTVTINQSSILFNTTSGDSAHGGAIYNHDGTLVVYQSSVESNSTSGDAAHGGGIYSLGTDLTVRDSTISANSVTGANSIGGGVYTDGESLATTTLILNSTISGNSSLFVGGGLFNAGGRTDILHSTVTENSATYIGSAGGVGSYGDSSTTLTQVGSSIISGNYAPSAGPLVASDVDRVGGLFEETFESLGFNLIGEGLSIDAFDPNVDGQPSDQVGVDAMLEVIGFNGGMTKTHALQAGSPAINTGDPLFDPTVFDPDLDTDQDGFLRVEQGIIDIGSHESFFAPPPPLAASSSSSSEDTPLAANASNAQFTITGNQAETPLQAASAETSGEEFEGLTTWLSRWKSRVAATLQTAAQRFNPDALAVSFDKFEVAARDASLAKFAHISDEVSQLTNDLGSLVEPLQPGTSSDEPVAEDLVFELLGEGLL